MKPDQSAHSCTSNSLDTSLYLSPNCRRRSQRLHAVASHYQSYMKPLFGPIQRCLILEISSSRTYLMLPVCLASMNLEKLQGSDHAQTPASRRASWNLCCRTRRQGTLLYVMDSRQTDRTLLHRCVHDLLYSLYFPVMHRSESVTKFSIWYRHPLFLALWSEMERFQSILCSVRAYVIPGHFGKNHWPVCERKSHGKFWWPRKKPWPSIFIELKDAWSCRLGCPIPITVTKDYWAEQKIDWSCVIVRGMGFGFSSFARLANNSCLGMGRWRPPNRRT